MVLIAPLGVAFLAALVAGGSFRGLSRVRFRHPVLLLGGILGEAAGSLLTSHTAGIALTVGAMGSSVVFLFLNRRHAGLALAGLGVALNALVLGVNGGMPVSPSALTTMGVTPGGLGFRHVLLTRDAVFPWLGDVFYVAPISKIVSIGDVLMIAGLCWFLYAVVTSREPGSRPLMVPLLSPGDGTSRTYRRHHGIDPRRL